MAVDRREKDTEWRVRDADGVLFGNGAVVAVLMDIRDELQLANRKLSALECPNFLAIPRQLARISANTAKPRKRKRAGATHGR